MSDMFNKAKDALTGGGNEADSAVDQAADAVKEKTPDQVDTAVEQVADKAKDAI